MFLGMPYAQPPVGNLRFRNPEPLNTTWSDANNATEYSPMCYGYGSDHWVLGNVISEDCLTINVVRPSGISQDTKLPVGFWIHGAGKPFIGVSINYRLDGFSFLWGTAVEQAGVANLGLKDQRLALHWVQENIAVFGGDPEKGNHLGRERWGHEFDGDFIPEAGATLLSEGKFVHVPILHGANHDEGTAFASRGINTTEQFLAYLVASTKNQETAEKLATLYPDIPEVGIPGTLHGRPGNETGYGRMFKRVAAYAGDRSMHAPRRFVSNIWAANNLVSYSYDFNVLVNGLTQYTGATHFQEVAFVFYNLGGNGYGNAVSVNPFLNQPKTFFQLARWPEYTLDDLQNIVFDVNVTDLAFIEPDIYRAEAIAFLNALAAAS
ncbi:hypothetical protein BBJ29_004500 [Phytophthora kernoviae]|nr:hypothetical protein BBJ29_004500 [Phytophthora kernoviae]